MKRKQRDTAETVPKAKKAAAKAEKGAATRAARDLYAAAKAEEEAAQKAMASAQRKKQAVICTLSGAVTQEGGEGTCLLRNRKGPLVATQQLHSWVKDNRDSLLKDGWDIFPFYYDGKRYYLPRLCIDRELIVAELLRFFLHPEEAVKHTLKEVKEGRPMAWHDEVKRGAQLCLADLEERMALAVCTDAGQPCHGCKPCYSYRQCPHPMCLHHWKWSHDDDDPSYSVSSDIDDDDDVCPHCSSTAEADE